METQIRKVFTLGIAIGVIVTIGGYFSFSALNLGNNDAKTLGATENTPKIKYKVGIYKYNPTLESIVSSFQGTLNQEFGSDYKIEYLVLDIPYSNINAKNAAHYFVEQEVDLIMTGQTALAEIQKVTSTIPIVVAPAVNPVSSGLAKSDAGSGNNAVFVESGNYNTAGDRLEYALELMPKVRTILVLRGDLSLPGASDSSRQLMDKVAAEKNISLIYKDFLTRQDLNKFILSYDFSQVDAIFRYPGVFMSENSDLFFSFKSKINKPIIVLYQNELMKGGILSYSSDNDELGRRGANLAYQLLKRDLDPSNIPILKPYKYELGINLVEAAKYGISVPAKLKAASDYLVEE